MNCRRAAVQKVGANDAGSRYQCRWTLTSEAFVLIAIVVRVMSANTQRLTTHAAYLD